MFYHDRAYHGFRLANMNFLEQELTIQIAQLDCVQIDLVSVSRRKTLNIKAGAESSHHKTNLQFQYV
jgi:hypothetical protein